MKLGKVLIYSIVIMVLLSPSLLADEILNSFRIQRQDYPSVALLANGNVAVGWGSFAYIINGPRMKIFSSDLTPLDPGEIRVSESTRLSYGPAVLKASSDSFFVAAFARYETSDSLDMNLFVRKFDNDGNALTEDIRVNDDSTGHQWPSSILINDSLGACRFTPPQTTVLFG